MSKTISVFLLLALMICGCNNDGSRTGANERITNEMNAADRGQGPAYIQTFSFEDGYVGVRSSHFDRPSHLLSLDLDCRRNECAISRTQIKLRAADSDSSESIVVEQFDRLGQLSFGLSMEVGTSNPNWARIAEYTVHDVLTLTRTVNTDSVTEHYVINDSAFALSFSRTLYDQLRSGDYQPNGSAASEYEAVLDQLALMYPGDGSLSSNADGELLVEILTNHDFLNWVALEHSESEGSAFFKPGLSLEEVCAIAWVCTALKCPIGLWLNPLCHVCAGVDIACGLAGALKVLHDWIF